jgi:hypothetical protein
MSDARGDGRWITCSVIGLVVMATWTLVIKFLAPVLYVVAEEAAGRTPAAAPIMWDFWWVAHVVLAWLLWRRHPLAWPAGLAVSACEVVIVTVKLVLYFRQPVPSFWNLLWLTNKIYVLTFFLFLLVLLFSPRFREEVRHG